MVYHSGPREANLARSRPTALWVHTKCVVLNWYNRSLTLAPRLIATCTKQNVTTNLIIVLRTNTRGRNMHHMNIILGSTTMDH